MHSADPAGGDGRRRLDVALFGAAVAISVFVLLWPNPPSAPMFAYADKLVHAGVFFALAWTGRRTGLPLGALAVGLVAYAVGSEVAQQTLLPERQGDWTDVVADLVGAAGGVLAARSRRTSARGR